MRLSLHAIGVCVAVGLSAGWAQAQTYEPPRLADGTPDLQGVWTNASVTELQRPSGFDKLVLSAEEAAALESQDFYVNRIRDDAQRVEDVENAPLLDGSDLLSGGGYNAFWVDPGTRVGVVKGEYRSSWIVSPADGRIPYSDAARARLAEIRAVREDYSNPESRPLGERCMVIGDRVGPPMLNGLYNNTYRFVQAPEHVMIQTEMVSHARVIPLTREHAPAAVQPLFGDSVAWWEGDTLVVETTNFHEAHSTEAKPALLSPAAKVTERFTRISERQIFYAFEIDDPHFYTQVWKGETSLNAMPDSLFEYACHEGNYSMEGVLKGAPVSERR